MPMFWTGMIVRRRRLSLLSGLGLCPLPFALCHYVAFATTWHKPFLHIFYRMPINKQGGKGCKKGKNGTKEDDDILMVECNSSDGQMFGRVLKVLGDRRFLIFCNDSTQRICKLAGSIRKNDRVEIGGIILISRRDICLNTSDVGDIISTVDTRLYGKLKKLSGINPLLFSDVEKQDANEVASRVKKMKEGDDEDLFDRGGEGASEAEAEEEEEEEAEPLVKAYSKEEIAEIEVKKVKEQLDREKKRKAKYDEDVRFEEL